MTKGKAYWFASIGLAVLLLSVATPAAAQRGYEPLFDKFSLRLEGSWISTSTSMRLDSELLGRGTTLDFEDDLDLAANQTIPSLSFDWQIAKRHKLAVRWQDLSRNSSSQALEEINWGDEVIPINADISLGFDVTQYFVDYAYYPWVKESWAAGFGLGVRVMELSATLAWAEEDLEGSTEAQGTGPLPYLYFEYRRLFSDDWRFVAGLGWLSVKVEDIEGSQWVGRAGIEYLVGEHWGFGAAFNLATIDVDWKGLETVSGESLYTGAIELDVNDVSLFARFRF
jgi:hypothetical protein